MYFKITEPFRNILRTTLLRPLILIHIKHGKNMSNISDNQYTDSAMLNHGNMTLYLPRHTCYQELQPAG